MRAEEAYHSARSQSFGKDGHGLMRRNSQEPSSTVRYGTSLPFCPFHSLASLEKYIPTQRRLLVTTSRHSDILARRRRPATCIDTAHYKQPRVRDSSKAAMVPSSCCSSSTNSDAATHHDSIMEAPTLVHTPELHHTSREDLTTATSSFTKGEKLPSDLDTKTGTTGLGRSAGSLQRRQSDGALLEKATSDSLTIYGSIYKGRGTQEDPYIVDWLEDDPENPLRWVSGRC